MPDEDASSENYEQQEGDEGVVAIVGRMPPQINPTFPTKDKFIKISRHEDNSIEEDSFIPPDGWIFAKILLTLKSDRYGRKYFNIRYASGEEAGVYLPKGGSGRRNDLIWEMATEEQFLQSMAAGLVQTDGALITPESLSPISSPEVPNPDRPDSPLWDHSPERLTEDNVFLWEEKPLTPLDAKEIKTSEQ